MDWMDFIDFMEGDSEARPGWSVHSDVRDGLFDLGGDSGWVDGEKLLSAHGGFRKLKSFQLAQLCYDVTVRFCEKYIDRRSRTFDQMVQAARSGTQNIAEGSEASGTSKKTELKLTGVAWASLGELALDYEDFLRQRKLKLWEKADARRKELVALRCTDADCVARWVREVHLRGRRGGQNETYAEIAANAALVLIGVTRALLDRQKQALAAAFLAEGGFTEKLYRIRTAARTNGGESGGRGWIVARK